MKPTWERMLSAAEWFLEEQDRRHSNPRSVLDVGDFAVPYSEIRARFEDVFAASDPVTNRQDFDRALKKAKRSRAQKRTKQ